MHPHIIAVFDRPDQAEQAYHALLAYVNRDDISIVHKPDAQAGSLDLSADTMINGMGWGALIGGGLGLAIGMSTLLVPGIGPVLAFGPIIAALAGTTAGGIAGGFLDLGVNRYTAERMAEHVEKGAVVLTVGVPNPALRDSIVQTLRQYGAHDIHDEPVEISEDVGQQPLG